MNIGYITFVPSGIPRNWRLAKCCFNSGGNFLDDGVIVLLLLPLCGNLRRRHILVRRFPLLIRSVDFGLQTLVQVLLAGLSPIPVVGGVVSLLQSAGGW